MTTIITRYFTDKHQAAAVRRELVLMERLSIRIILLYDTAEGLVDKLVASQVPAQTAEAYAARMAKGGAVMLVRANARPLGVAATTRAVTARMGAQPLDGIAEEVKISTAPGAERSVLSDHPHLLSRGISSDMPITYMADWPIRLISRRKPHDVHWTPRHGRMASWPFGLLSDRKPFTGSIFSRHARMASFPIGLISRRKPKDRSAFSRHARMAAFPLPLLSRRKPYTGTIIGRHQRMANFPFPHLLNGRAKPAGLLPGSARMANFPIGLLSNRKPYTGSVVGKHARMANFPISLISRRVPFSKSAFPRHARMAEMALFPLVVKHGEDPGAGAKEGFSFSRMLGLSSPTRR
ncbi:PucR family transcriptional regulator [Roseobacteraceae bacterium S113]